MEIKFTINGKQVTKDIEPSAMLLDVIRDKLLLKGTKPGCREGECGACTVLVDGVAVNSCLYLAVNASNKEITTIEGLGLNDGTLDKVQEMLIKNWGVQCGFCTSGMVMSIKYFTDKCKANNHFPDRDEIAKHLEGNLCRCTGYVKIIDAAQAVLNQQ